MKRWVRLRLACSLPYTSSGGADHENSNESKPECNFRSHVSGLLYLLPSNLMAGTPTDQIRATVDEVVAILKDPQFKSEERHEERRQRLKQAINRRFDFTEMARRSLGREWRRLTPAERDQFTLLFTDLQERTYIDRLQSLDDEEIDFQGERREGDYAEVES